MSFRVRFTDGSCAVYNDACYLRYTSHAHELYTKNPDQGGKWLASIPVATQCVIEAVPACPIENAAGVDSAALTLLHNLRRAPHHLVRDLKLEQRNFNSRTRTWRSE